MPHSISQYHLLSNPPLDVQARKELCKANYTKWDSNKHLTAFGKHQDDDQLALVRLNITIDDDD